MTILYDARYVLDWNEVLPNIGSGHLGSTTKIGEIDTDVNDGKYSTLLSLTTSAFYSLPLHATALTLNHRGI